MVTRIIHFGLGAMGAGIANLSLTRRDVEVVGAFDGDPAKVGRDLADLAGIDGRSGVIVADPAASDPWPAADVVVHATTSSLEEVAPQLEAAISRGLDVVSICEELSLAAVRYAKLAAPLDRLAREQNVSVLGTGVNPGFAMDTWPIMLTAISRSVESIHVTRVLDAAGRRLPLQQKVGAGITTSEFARRVSDGKLGHVGLVESAMAIAAAMRWEPYDTVHSLEPVIASQPTSSEHISVATGDVTGIHEVVSLKRSEREVVRLELTMALGVGDPKDEVRIDGDPPVHVVAQNGFHGDRSTAGIAVNSALAIREAPPGLLTMRDLPPVHWSEAVHRPTEEV